MRRWCWRMDCSFVCTSCISFLSPHSHSSSPFPSPKQNKTKPVSLFSWVFQLILNLNPQQKQIRGIFLFLFIHLLYTSYFHFLFLISSMTTLWERKMKFDIHFKLHLRSHPIILTFLFASYENIT